MNKISKLISISVITLLGVSGIVFAAPTTLERPTSNDHVEPRISTDYIKANYYVATSTTATSTFANAIKIGLGDDLEFNNIPFRITLDAMNEWFAGFSNRISDIQLFFGADPTTNNTKIQSFNDNTPDELLLNPAGGNVGIGTTSPYAKLSVVGPVVAQYFNATSTTATSTFNNMVSIRSSLFLGNTVNLQSNGFGTGYARIQTSTSSNDIEQWQLINRSTGSSAAGCMFFVNDKSTIDTIGVAANYYGGTCLANSNYNIPGFNALRPNGIALFATDGPVTIGSGSSNSASSSIYFQAGSGLDSSYDAVLTGGTGNLGIGTTSPYAKLSVVGDVVARKFIATTSVASTFPYASTTGISSVYASSTSMYTNGLYFVASSSALYFTDSNAPIVPVPCLHFGGGNQNTFIGCYAGNFTNTGNPAQNHDSRNVGLGYYALRSLTSGTDNLAIGRLSLYGLTTGIGNVIVGGSAGISITNQSSNTSIGYLSMLSSIGDDNSVFGHGALQGGSGGVNRNVVAGMQALYSMTSGNNNVALGRRTGFNQTSGNGNILLGNHVDAPSLSGSQQLNIGNIIYGTSLYNSDFSNSSVPVGAAKIGIGTTTPYAKLSIVGETVATNFTATSSAATSTFSGGLYVSQTSSSTAPYIYSRTSGFGGHLIIEDEGGGACTEITTKAGVINSRVITCPVEK